MQRLVSGVLNGRSACVLAYGQTGSGKTHTMYGTLADGADGAGLVPRAIRALLTAVDERTASGKLSASVSLACVEVFGKHRRRKLEASAAAQPR